MSELSKRTFLITLACADGEKRLRENKDKPFHTNFASLEIRLQPSAKKKDPKVQKCKYIPSTKAAYSDDDRSYIQIWELDKWKEGKKKGKEKDAGAKKSAKNDLLAEFGGFIKEVTKGKEYKFITDGKGTTFPKAPTDKKLGKLLLKMDQLQKDGPPIKKDVIVPIQGEVETILEIGVVYQDTANQESYIDNYERPVYPIRNISKIIQEQLDEGGLRVICYSQYNRKVDKDDLKFYRDNRGKEKKGTKKLPGWPEGVTKDDIPNLKDWVAELIENKEYDGNIPAQSSTLSIYEIVNDDNFRGASERLAKKVNSLYVNSKNEIGVERFEIFDWKEIQNNVNKLIEAVYKQYKGSAGEKPKVLKLGIYCHGVPTSLNTGGRLPNQTNTNKKPGGHLKMASIPQFVKSFIVEEGKTKRKLLADNVVIALYACSTGRSSFTTTGKKKDNTFGKKPPPGKSLGEGSFARALRDELHLDGRFPDACVYSHTTVGDADANPKIRLFSADGEVDKVGLAGKERETIRDTMFTLP